MKYLIEVDDRKPDLLISDGNLVFEKREKTL